MSGTEVVARSVAESLRGPGLGSEVGKEMSGVRYWTRTQGWGDDVNEDSGQEGDKAVASSGSRVTETR